MAEVSGSATVFLRAARLAIRCKAGPSYVANKSLHLAHDAACFSSSVHSSLLSSPVGARAHNSKYLSCSPMWTSKFWLMPHSLPGPQCFRRFGLVQSLHTAIVVMTDVFQCFAHLLADFPKRGTCKEI